MSSLSSVEAKFKRSSITRQKTSLWKEANDALKNEFSSIVRLESEAEILIYFENKLRNYLITNKRLIINLNKEIYLEDIDRVFFDKIVREESGKKELDMLNITYKSKNIDLYVEVGTWPLIYQLLTFIIQLVKREKL